MNYTSKKEQICQSPSNIHLHFEMIPRVKQNQINVLYVLENVFKFT